MKIKAPSGIYAPGSEPTHGVYRALDLRVLGEHALAVSHHWSEVQAWLAAAPHADQTVVSFDPATTLEGAL